VRAREARERDAVGGGRELGPGKEMLAPKIWKRGIENGWGRRGVFGGVEFGGSSQRGDLGFPGVGVERQSPFPFHRGKRPPLASGQLAVVTPWLLRVCVSY
jgi:hypothetical protein